MDRDIERNKYDGYSSIPLYACVGMILGMLVGTFTQSLWSPVCGILAGCFFGIVRDVLRSDDEAEKSE